MSTRGEVLNPLLLTPTYLHNDSVVTIGTRVAPTLCTGNSRPLLTAVGIHVQETAVRCRYIVTG